jgi:PPOX class probable F420-dependent enzyme
MASSPAASIPPPVAGFIASGRVGRLATADAGGQPLVVPICYAFDGQALYSAVDAKPKRTAPAGLKRIRNLRENPRVSIVIDEYEEDWTRLRYVIIQGRADLLTDGPQFTHGVALLVSKYPQYQSLGLPRERGLMIRVTPSRVSAWQYSS